MALGFGSANTAQGKEKVPTLKYKDGEQMIRAISGIIPRYLYWVPNPNYVEGGVMPKEVPFEALQFNRETQEWDNTLAEPVKEKFPDLKPKWSYISLGMTPNNEIVAWPHKKKLLSQIQDAAETLGDPTDLEKGWWIVFKRKKTGPAVFNVEYTLDQLKSMKKQEALTTEQRELVGAFKTVEELFPRPTEQEVRDGLEKFLKPRDNTDGNVDPEAMNSFDEDAIGEDGVEIT